MRYPGRPMPSATVPERGSLARCQLAALPDDVGAHQGRARTAAIRRDAGSHRSARRGARERAALGARGRPRGGRGGHRGQDRARMTGSSRRGFLREIAAAAARRIPEVPSLEAEPMPPPAPPLSDAELVRYSRQLVLPQWSESAQVALRDASVLVVGAGALGSPVALYLAGAGVGRLGLVDSDVVELSNLPRQLLHYTPDMGAPKVESAASKLRFLNPDVLVETFQVRLE